MRHVKPILGLGMLLASSVASAAAFVSFSPASGNIEQGGATAVDVMVNGLSDGGAPSLGGFFIEVLFDASVLDLDPALVTFSPFLGDVNVDTDTIVPPLTSPGQLALDSISLLIGTALDTLQPATFPLATLAFEGHAVGTGTLSFATVELYDADGSAIATTAPGTGTIDVTARQDTPIPSSLLLLAPGLLLLRPVLRLRPTPAG